MTRTELWDYLIEVVESEVDKAGTEYYDSAEALLEFVIELRKGVTLINGEPV